MSLVLRNEPLTRESFARFGDVIEATGREHFTINQGNAERFNDLARIDTAGEGGETTISIARGMPLPFPISLKLVERHPLGSQIFFPLQDEDWLIVVAGAEDRPTPRSLRAFRAKGRQGINFARNVWHHPLLMPSPAAEFLIIDRKGPGNNLEEHWFAEDERPVLEA
jgi:ureidoglycolate lyase